MIIVGLTGSIGMGKSTTAKMFADQGVPVHDADAAVHLLYSGKAAPLVESAFPGTVIDGVVDRGRLAEYVVGDSGAMSKLEAIVHPLVREAELDFLERAEKAGKPFVILDIPLLFETDGDKRTDYSVVVSAPAAVQRERVMRRPGMTEDRFGAVLAKQMPDDEKRRRADFVIDTSLGMECAAAKVSDLISVFIAFSRDRKAKEVLEGGGSPL